MADGTHEQTINAALGEVLAGLIHGWRVSAERIGGVVERGGRPDILVEDQSGWPVVIEAEVGNHRQAERDALARLGGRLSRAPRTIETAVALVYPEALRHKDAGALRNAILSARFEYAVFTSTTDHSAQRFPLSGWLSGGVGDLAMLTHRVSVPPSRVEALAVALEGGVNRAEGYLSAQHPHGSPIGSRVAGALGQVDDEAGQSRKMALTVVTNALVFHAALAEASMLVPDVRTRRDRPVKSPIAFRVNAAFRPTPLLDEWAAILIVNYWPIFHTASTVLRELPTRSAAAILDTLWQTSEDLIAGGVTKSHDLTGVIFQRLIADRKFLATFYTRPAAAALLAGLALPVHRPLAGATWESTKDLSAVRIGDFACGTGTLLSTAYQRLSLLHEIHGGDPQALHKEMMMHGLVGLDVLNVAVHLTAAMLAGTHPDTPFAGECLLTMPYGTHEWGCSLGSLDLLAAQIPIDFMQAAAKTAGGKGEEDVRDLMRRVGHGQFQLVIMNPPFTRHGAHEGERIRVHNPAFAAFEADETEQDALARHLKRLAKGSCAHGHAGMASYFVELAHRKLAPSGVVALVLPMSAMSGQAWEGVRVLLRDKYDSILVVSIAERKSFSRSFSADTGMAECLVLAVRSKPRGRIKRAHFAVLDGQPQTTLEGDLIAAAITAAISSDDVRKLEDGPFGGTRVSLGSTEVGEVIDCPLPHEGGWPMVGVNGVSLGQTAYQVSQGRLWIEGTAFEQAPDLPVAAIADIGARMGPHHLDISGAMLKGDGLPQGPFSVHPGMPPGAGYPALWNHDADRERTLVVTPDSHCQVRDIGGQIPQRLQERAAMRWATATRAHYNQDLQFNSQSLIVAMTERPCIGGRAWPSVIFDAPDHEFAFALWCNSTLGLLCHWWQSNKSQSGRGTTTVTSVPLFATLDVRALSKKQHAAAKAAYNAMSHLRFLPFDQVDEDPARAELDRHLLVDVLGLSGRFCHSHGPLALLRQKLAAEPQIQGGKRTRVVFTRNGETSEPRSDR